MYKTERRAIEFLEKNAYLIFIAIATVLSLILRWHGRNVESLDYTVCFRQWFYYICYGGGFHALVDEVGNYNVLYQFIIAFLTKLPIDPLYSIKFVSIVFDYSLAYGCGMLASDLIRNKIDIKVFTPVYTAVLFLPSVFLDSAFWAQCDSIYVSFIIWGLLMLRKKRFNLAFFLMGISLAFKLQLIFIVPFLICLYVSKKEFSLLHFLWLPGTLFLSTLPAIMVGREWTAFIDVYLDQMGCDRLMTCNLPNFWYLFNGNYDHLSGPAVILTIVILGLGLLHLIKNKTDLGHPELFVLMAAWTSLTCVTILPAMHNRYLYLVDMLVLILAAMDIRKYLKFLVFLIILDAVTYSHFLFGASADYNLLSAAYIIVYAYFSYLVYKADDKVCCEGNSNDTE